MNRRNFVLLASLLSCLTACATPAIEGPGMTVTFNNISKGKSIFFDSLLTASGARFPNPGFLAPSSRPIMNGKIMAASGKTMGAAPDGRELPEWVEFEWREPEYRKDDYTREQLKALPHSRARVLVRSRVPQSVIAEVMESNRQRQRGNVPDKMLWIYFVWTDSGIKFRWELDERGHETKQMGGDEIEQ